LLVEEGFLLSLHLLLLFHLQVLLLVLKELAQVSLLCLLFGKHLRSEGAPFKLFFFLNLLKHPDLLVFPPLIVLDTFLNLTDVEATLLSLVEVFFRNEQIGSLLLVKLLDQLVVGLAKVSLTLWVYVLFIYD
jgi:hypothetical protein